MLVGICYPSKQPGETWTVEVDVADLLVPAETISAQSATSHRRSDGLDTTLTFLAGQPDRSDTRIRVRTRAGAAGETHRIQFTVSTAAPYSNVWKLEVDVPVEDLSR